MAEPEKYPIGELRGSKPIRRHQLEDGVEESKLYRKCLCKIRHETAQGARKAYKELRKRVCWEKRASLTVYFCEYCKGYHLGKDINIITEINKTKVEQRELLKGSI